MLNHAIQSRGSEVSANAYCSPKLVLLNNTDMKIVNSSPVSAFGGLNFVIKEVILRLYGNLNFQT